MNKKEKNNFVPGDMSSEEFRKYGYQLIDWIADYLDNIEELPVLSQIKPGEVKDKIPPDPPADKESMDSIFADVDKIIMPGMTHWNHPSFHAYFNSTGSKPGILAELLSAAFNINGMNWRSCPSATELEQVMLNWLRKMLDLPGEFWGIIFETGSFSSMHAIAAAREYVKDYNFRKSGMSGVKDFPRLRLYNTEHTHSSIDKGAITVGIGLDGIRKIPVDKYFKMIPAELEKAIQEDKENGWLPFCVVATVGTTSCTAIDPVEKIAKICERENIWLHVDAAHAGIAAIVPEMKNILAGCEKADSFLVNPHKWLFSPIDLSTLYTRRPEILKRSFSLVAEYLKTSEDSEVENYMDYGVSLGRRFRSLKLWFIIRYFGKDGLIKIIREHIRLGRLFAKWIDEDENFERLAPVPLSTTCFRALPKNLKSDEEINSFNQNLMDNINSTGKVFISHTKLNEKFVIRFVVSSLRTQERHVIEAWEVIKNEFDKLSNEGNK
jgi:aromatic-L-amino-acid decarboxylase